MSVKNFRVLKINDGYMNGTEQYIAVMRLVEIEYMELSGELSGELSEYYTFGTEDEKFLFDYYDGIVERIIDLAKEEEVVRLNMNDFRTYRELINGKEETVHHHRSIISVDQEEEGPKIVQRQIKIEVLCKTCRDITRINLDLNIPKEIYLDIEEFEAASIDWIITCSYCGREGGLGDKNAFDIVKTKGLDEDLAPALSSFQKKSWFHELDFIFQHYLKEIFEVNVYDKVGFAYDLYQCKFILEKQFERPTPAGKLSFYLTKSIELVDGSSKMVTKKYPFVLPTESNTATPHILIIDPEQFTAKEKRVGPEVGLFPFLEEKDEK